MTDRMSREESRRIYAELRETEPATPEKAAHLAACDGVFARQTSSLTGFTHDDLDILHVAQQSAARAGATREADALDSLRARIAARIEGDDMMQNDIAWGFLRDRDAMTRAGRMLPPTERLPLIIDLDDQ